MTEQRDGTNYSTSSASTVRTKVLKYVHGAIRESGNTQFGLLGVDGQVHNFEIESRALTSLAIQTADAARSARFYKNGNRGKLMPLLQPIRLPQEDDGSLSPLIGPMIKHARSRDLVDYLCAIMDGYEDRVIAKANKISENTESAEWEFSFDLAPPAVIPLVMGEVLHHARSALDLLICDVARLRGDISNTLSFPFGKSEGNFTANAKAVKRLGEDVFSAVRDLQPFTGGDPVLDGLHRLDIIGKHRLVIPTFIAAGFHYRHTNIMAKAMAEKLPGLSCAIYNGGFAHIEETGGMPPDAAFVGSSGEHRYAPFVIRHGDKHRFKIGLDPNAHLVRLDQGISACFPIMENMPFSGEPVLPVLAQMTERVRQIIVSFEELFGDQVAARD